METEFSKILDVDKLLKKAHPLEIQATEQECAAIAKRLGLVEVASFKATVTVHLPSKIQKLPKLDVVLNASFTQTCVTSLKKLEDTVEEEFSLFLSSDKDPEETLDEESLLDLANEEAETLYLDGADDFDMGEILVQYFSLAVDPYPRHPEAALETFGAGGEGANPFDKLKGLGEKG